MTALSQNQIQMFNERLTVRRNQLLDDVIERIRGEDSDSASHLEEQLTQKGEACVVDEIISLQLDYLEREIRQLHGVQSAKQRIKDGTYGICIDCQQEINPDRLELQPSATRCGPCQEHYESIHGSEEREDVL